LTKSQLSSNEVIYLSKKYVYCQFVYVISFSLIWSNHIKWRPLNFNMTKKLIVFSRNLWMTSWTIFTKKILERFNEWRGCWRSSVSSLIFDKFFSSLVKKSICFSRPKTFFFINTFWWAPFGYLYFQLVFNVIASKLLTSIQYRVPGFEPMTSQSWAICLNH